MNLCTASHRFAEGTGSPKSSTEHSASTKTDDLDPGLEPAEYAATLTLRKEYVAARNPLCRAETEFQARGQASDREDYVISQVLRNFSELQDTAQELINLNYMERISRLTRDFIDAEDGCEKAKAVAINDGWVLDDQIDNDDGREVYDYHPIQNILVKGAPLKRFAEGFAFDGGYHIRGPSAMSRDRN
jgi:hypothetical protein